MATYPRVDIGTPSDDGMTLLWIATYRRNTQIVKAIIEYLKPINIDAKYNASGATNKTTVIHEARDNKLQEIIDLIETHLNVHF